MGSLTLQWASLCLLKLLSTTLWLSLYGAQYSYDGGLSIRINSVSRKYFLPWILAFILQPLVLTTHCSKTSSFLGILYTNNLWCTYATSWLVGEGKIFTLRYANFEMLRDIVVDISNYYPFHIATTKRLCLVQLGLLVENLLNIYKPNHAFIYLRDLNS